MQIIQQLTNAVTNNEVGQWLFVWFMFKAF